MFKSWARLCWEHKRNTEHLTHIIIYITAYRCHVFFSISNVYIKAVLSAILTFVPRQHVFKLNKLGKVNKSPLINKYLFGKSERPWAHELMSQTGGELMSWSLSVSAALAYVHLMIFSKKRKNTNPLEIFQNIFRGSVIPFRKRAFNHFFVPRELLSKYLSDHMYVPDVNIYFSATSFYFQSFGMQ